MLDSFFAPAMWLMGRLSYLFRTLLLFIMILALLAGTIYLNEHSIGDALLEEVAYDLLMILFALWLYLFVGSYLGVKKAIEYLGYMSDAATQGELLEHQPLQSRDEFGKISHAMSRIIGTMQQNLKMLREYQGAVDSGTLLNKTDPDGNITYVNAAFEKLSGYSLEELRGKTHRVLRSPGTSDLQIQMLWDTLGDKEVYRGVFENIAKDGSSFFVKITIIPILDKQGDVTEYLAIMSDITALKAHEKRLETQLYTDDLTGFDNRNAFHKAVMKSRDPKMMLLNVDGFSAINTIYGEAVGDVLITQLGIKLQTM
ncbi:MAG: PAS domain S-box protein, partial [Sulfurimonadaceae bacterium]|nr:PAS domain S-box protein [Sulfurimonadaceae bacterium]